MDIHQIVVPVDFSTCSMLVVGRASSLAKKLGARILLLHIAEVPEGVAPETLVRPDGVPVKAGDFALTGAKAGMERMVAEARHHGVEPLVVVRTGPVVDTILEVADEHQGDLLVIGTHGRTGIARMMLGSVAEQVARRAKAPVMLIRREVRPECHRASCDWCNKHDKSPQEEALDAEVNG
ncbi:MAG: universal stress protein [Myxococcales bacterium]|nr:universal stress protein [Myxococcales bacterium]